MLYQHMIDLDSVTLGTCSQTIYMPAAYQLDIAMHILSAEVIAIAIM